MSSARIGVPPANVWQWSDAHWLTSLRSRGDHESSTHPEPPPSALPIATNSDRQRSNDPKSRQRVAQRRTRFALVAEAVEEQLVQDHRVHRDELLAFESVDEKAGGLRVIELGELLVDQIEAFHRPAVIILVVADDQPLGHAFDLGRVAGQRLYSVRHHRSSDHGRALISNLFFPKPMLALPSTANAGATMHAANTAAEIPRSAVARPFIRSLPADKERSPRCSSPRASGSCRP